MEQGSGHIGLLAAVVRIRLVGNQGKILGTDERAGFYPSCGGLWQLQQGQHGSWEAFVSPQGGCNDWGGAGEYLDTRYMLKIEPSGCANGLELVLQRERNHSDN